MYDVLIIGAGPAGISASLYTKRANLNTIILHYGESSLEKAKRIENYYGFENGIDGKTLYNNGIKQAKNLGVEVKEEEILKIEAEKVADNSIFKITTTKSTYEAKSLIIAIGAKKNKLKIKGVKELEGKGISYCAICDGFFYRNKDVSVLGSGNYALSETNDLINIAKTVTILTNGESKPDFRADNVQIITKPIEEIKGENRVEEVVFNDKSTLKTNGIFIAQGTAGSVELAKKLGLLLKDDKIIVNSNMETNIKGVYACGDCTGGILQISNAVSEGTTAALSLIQFLRKG